MLGHLAVTLVIRAGLQLGDTVDGILAPLPTQTVLGSHQREAEIILCYCKIYVKKNSSF